MSKTTIYNYNPLEMMEKLLNNTNPIIQNRDYFIDEKDNEYLLELPVAGFTQNAISVEVDENVLVISGEDSESYWTKDFVKKFKFPAGANPDSISAKITDGILKIIISKKKESLPKKIKIS